MDDTDPARVTWTWAREHAGAINSAQFVLMLLNFNVLPVLLSKTVALEVFVRCEADNDGDERANAMFYPAFLETIAEVRDCSGAHEKRGHVGAHVRRALLLSCPLTRRSAQPRPPSPTHAYVQVALEVGVHAVSRIRAATSPDDLKVLRRYADSCPPPHGTSLMEVRVVRVGGGGGMAGRSAGGVQSGALGCLDFFVTSVLWVESNATSHLVRMSFRCAVLKPLLRFCEGFEYT